MEQQHDIKRVSFVFTIDGVKYPCKKPNLGMIRTYSAEQKLVKDDPEKALEGAILFLTRLGMPGQVVEDMDAEMMEDVVLRVSGQKKS